MTVYYPEATPSLAATKVAVVVSVPIMTAPDLSTDIGAATTYDASLTLREFNPVINMNTGTAPRRLGTKAQMPSEGLSQYQAIELRYVYNPQEDDAHADNEFKAAMTSGSVVYLVERRGGDAVEDDFAVGDRTRTWKVRCGRQNYVPSGDDEFAEFEVMQNVFPMEPEVEGVVVA